MIAIANPVGLYLCPCCFKCLRYGRCQSLAWRVARASLQLPYLRFSFLLERRNDSETLTSWLKGFVERTWFEWKIRVLSSVLQSVGMECPIRSFKNLPTLFSAKHCNNAT